MNAPAPVPNPAQVELVKRILRLQADIVTLDRRLDGTAMIPRRPAGQRERVAGELKTQIRAKIEEHDRLLEDLKKTLPGAEAPATT